VAIDERLIGALHVERLQAAALHAGHEPHQIFQASTISTLLDGAYDGDVSVSELSRQGDLGLGTLNAVDGELIIIDGRFLRADAEGRINEVDPSEKTPFAVLTFFEAAHQFDVEDVSQEELLAEIDRRVGHPEVVHALRIDGSFELVHARSVPRQSKPYPPMVDVVASQNVFDFDEIEGTMVGFRFPDYAEGINVPGYHLHFADPDRARGGHVLDVKVDFATVRIDDSVDVHVEVPKGVELSESVDEDALRKVEREG
jgi:acetolactate decarboxylase